MLSFCSLLNSENLNLELQCRSVIVKLLSDVGLVLDIMHTKRISREMWGDAVETGTYQEGVAKWPADLSLPIHLGGTKSATDKSADYGLSRAAFMKNRKTRWAALIPEEELDPDGNILMENVGLGGESARNWQLGRATSHSISSLCLRTWHLQTDFYVWREYAVI